MTTPTADMKLKGDRIRNKVRSGLSVEPERITGQVRSRSNRSDGMSASYMVNIAGKDVPGLIGRPVYGEGEWVSLRRVGGPAIGHYVLEDTVSYGGSESPRVYGPYPAYDASVIYSGIGIHITGDGCLIVGGQVEEDDDGNEHVVGNHVAVCGSGIRGYGDNGERLVFGQFTQEYIYTENGREYQFNGGDNLLGYLAEGHLFVDSDLGRLGWYVGDQAVIESYLVAGQPFTQIRGLIRVSDYFVGEGIEIGKQPGTGAYLIQLLNAIGMPLAVFRAGMPDDPWRAWVLFGPPDPYPNIVITSGPDGVPYIRAHGGIFSDGTIPDSALVLDYLEAAGDTLYGNLVVEAGFTIDTIDISEHNHSGTAGDGVQILLNYLDDPDGDTTLQMVDNHLLFRWVQPVAGGGINGAVEFEASGAFTGDLVHLHQHTGNPAATVHLLHAEAEDVDVHVIHVTHTANDAAALGIHVVMGNSAADSFRTEVSGDTVPRFLIEASGLIQWGPGNAALDTSLYRSAANTLKTDDDFYAVHAGVVVLQVETSDDNIASVVIKNNQKTFTWRVNTAANKKVFGLFEDAAAQPAFSFYPDTNQFAMLWSGMTLAPPTGIDFMVSGIIGSSDRLRLWKGATDYVNVEYNLGLFQIEYADGNNFFTYHEPTHEAAVGGNYVTGYAFTLARAGSTGTLHLPSTTGTAVGGIWWSTDTNLYRSAANVLKTDDTLVVVASLGVVTSTPLVVQGYTFATPVITLDNGTARADINVRGNPVNVNLVNASGAADDKWVQLNMRSTGLFYIRSINDANTAAIKDTIMVFDISTGEIGVGVVPTSGSMVTITGGAIATGTALNIIGIDNDAISTAIIVTDENSGVYFSVKSTGDGGVVGKVFVGGELEIDGVFNHDGTTVGFYNTAPATKQTVSGSRGANAALASLLTALATIGLITDSSSA